MENKSLHNVEFLQTLHNVEMISLQYMEKSINQERGILIFKGHKNIDFLALKDY